MSKSHFSFFCRKWKHNKTLLNLIFNEKKAEPKSCLLYIDLVSKLFCGIKNKETQTNGVLYNKTEITVILNTECRSAAIETALSKRHSGKRGLRTLRIQGNLSATYKDFFRTSTILE